MSGPKKQKLKKKKKGPLSPPPPRTKSPSPSKPSAKSKLLPLKPRTRSRSANNRPPNHPTPPAPQRAKSRGRDIDKTKKAKKTKPNKPPPKALSNNTNNRNKAKKEKNKELPPSRIRAKTTSIKSSLPSSPPTIHQLPSIGFNDNDDIDNIATKGNKPRKRGSKIQKKPLPPNTKKSSKNVTLPPQIDIDDDEKENDLNLESNIKKKGGHYREYSIVKSVPSMFKSTSISIESPRNTRQFGLKSPKGSDKKGFAAFMDERNGLIAASCQCGNIKYELLELPQELQHCYCSMCRKQHGSSVATWTPMLEGDIRFIKNGKQTIYQSSDNVRRSFCSICGSNISLKYLFQSDTIWITPSLFDGLTKENVNNINAKTWWLNVRVLHIFCASKCEWYDIPNDGHPQLSQSDIEHSEIEFGEPRFVYNKKLPPKPSQN